MGTSWISRKGRILEKGGGVEIEKGVGVWPPYQLWFRKSVATIKNSLLKEWVWSFQTLNSTFYAKKTQKKLWSDILLFIFLSNCNEGTSGIFVLKCFNRSNSLILLPILVFLHYIILLGNNQMGIVKQWIAIKSTWPYCLVYLLILILIQSCHIIQLR